VFEITFNSIAMSRCSCWSLSLLDSCEKSQLRPLVQCITKLKWTFFEGL